MPYIEPQVEDWKRTLSRVLIVGPPDSGKTHSLQTWPHSEEEGNLIIQSYPGEKGTNSIPRGAHIKPFQWVLSQEERQDTRYITNQVEKLTKEIVGGKHGKIATFAGDGIHKLVEMYLNVASEGAYFKGEEFEPKLYTRCYGMFLSYLDIIMSSEIPNVVFTCWDGREPDEYKGVKVKEGRVYPELPGKLAKKIIGEFSVRLFASLDESPIPGKPPKAMWTLKQDAKLGAVGVKLPADVQLKVPNQVEQDWGKLYKLLLDGGA